MTNTAISEKSISILGCGWLGLPLARTLASSGHIVNGSTTQPQKLPILKEAGINGFLIDYSTSESDADVAAFYNAKTLFINIPPKTRHSNGSKYLEQLAKILESVRNSAIGNIVHISSTSVYPDLNMEMKEEQVTKTIEAENQVIFTAEEMIRNTSSIPHLILRCGGLTGYDRILIKHFAGRRDLEGGSSPVNLIHRDDLVGIIVQLLAQNNCWNQTINLCAPLHPTRKEFYEHLALSHHYAMPYFKSESTEPFKIINTEKLSKLVDYQFQYPDPMKFTYD